jgi:hypothetical protein
MKKAKQLILSRELALPEQLSRPAGRLRSGADQSLLNGLYPIIRAGLKCWQRPVKRGFSH